jgi:DNA-binding CsgD family transcriptional regulator
MKIEDIHMTKMERDKTIIRLRYNYYLTLQEIAEKFGISAERVRQICERDKPKNAVDPLVARRLEKHKRVKRLWAEGMTAKEISAKIDKCSMTVYRYATGLEFDNYSTPERRIRDRRIMIMKENGYTAKRIAEELEISPNTVFRALRRLRLKEEEYEQ